MQLACYIACNKKHDSRDLIVYACLRLMKIGSELRYWAELWAATPDRLELESSSRMAV